MIYQFLKNNNYNNIQDFVDKNTHFFISKFTFTIAIVDDESGEFPIEYLRRLGHQVDEIHEVSLAEVNKLLSYDLIFLDMIGVVKEDAERGAMQLIKKIKEHQFNPYVIAVSKSKFDPTVTEYFKLADDIGSKPMDEIKCDQLINLYLTDCSPESCAKEIDKLLHKKSIPQKITEKATKIIIDLLSKKIDFEKFKNSIFVLPANVEKDMLIKKTESLYRVLK